jgi:hypothetical protein
MRETAVRLRVRSSCEERKPRLASPSPPPRVDRRRRWRDGGGSRGPGRRAAATDYRKKLLRCRKLEARVKTGTARSISRAFVAAEDLSFVVRTLGARGRVLVLAQFGCGGV